MPLETPFRNHAPAQQIAFIHVVTPRNEMQSAIRSALHELTAVLQSQTVRPSGPWLAHHHRPPTDTFDFDLCFPVDEAVVPTGRVNNGEIAETDVARAIYRGSYDGLTKAWPEFRQWVAENGYKTRQDAWEVYAVGPQQTSNPEEWETELNYPLM